MNSALDSLTKQEQANYEERKHYLWYLRQKRRRERIEQENGNVDTRCEETT